MRRKPGLNYTLTDYQGYAGIQIDVRDGGTRDLLAAMVDRDRGDFGLVDGHVKSQFGDAEKFSSRWAEELTKLLSGE